MGGKSATVSRGRGGRCPAVSPVGNSGLPLAARFVPPCIPTRLRCLPDPSGSTRSSTTAIGFGCAGKMKPAPLYPARFRPERSLSGNRPHRGLCLPVVHVSRRGVVCGMDGPAIFADLHRRGIVSETMLYAFDLLAFGGEDLRPFPLSDRKRLHAMLIGRRSQAESNAADAIMPRLSPSRSRVLILPTQEFGGMSVCRAGLRSGGRVRSRRRYQRRRSNYHLASSGSGIRRRPKGAVSCGSGDDRRHHHDCREASDQTHQGFILVRESPDCNIGASW
jgi:hypothetical protein